MQYSPDREFTLPTNLFIIGTMNTADQSIARIESSYVYDGWNCTSLTEPSSVRCRELLAEAGS